jgi:enamine deaminase RidA (YjgF/YER057c/UK114 family)
MWMVASVRWLAASQKTERPARLSRHPIAKSGAESPTKVLTSAGQAPSEPEIANAATIARQIVKAVQSIKVIYRQM